MGYEYFLTFHTIMFLEAQVLNNHNYEYSRAIYILPINTQLFFWRLNFRHRSTINAKRN